MEGRTEPILCCDEHGSIIFKNTAFEVFFQSISPTPLQNGLVFLNLLPARCRESWSEMIAEAQSGQYHQRFYSHDQNSLGEKPNHYRLSFSPTIVNRQVQGWSLVVLDFTACLKHELQLEAAYKKLEDQLVEEANHIEANVILAKEIADRKHAEENLLETQERLTQIIHGNSIPTFVIDQNHRITHWNKALERLTGISRSTTVGTDDQWKAFYTHKRPTMADLILDQAPEEKISSLYTDKYRQSELLEDSYEVEDFFELGGNNKWLFFTAAPLMNRAGEIIGAIETLQDITARKLMEQEILKYQTILEGKVEERTMQLKKTYEQLLHAEKLSAVGKLAASIAHEFGNPIIGIRNFLKGLKKTTTLDRTDSELLDLAIQECQRVKDLISNLQNFNRPTSGTIAPIHLHKAIEDMLLFCKKSFKEKEIEVEIDFDPGVEEILAVQDQIKQVILNCLNNAQEAIGGAGIISLKTEIEDDQVLLHISDTGHGIKEEDLIHIFEPFYSTKPAVEGTGLGLSVSYGIMKRHQGNIEVTETSDKGTTFTLTLPLEGLSS